MPIIRVLNLIKKALLHINREVDLITDTYIPYIGKRENRKRAEKIRTKQTKEKDKRRIIHKQDYSLLTNPARQNIE